MHAEISDNKLTTSRWSEIDTKMSGQSENRFSCESNDRPIRWSILEYFYVKQKIDYPIKEFDFNWNKISLKADSLIFQYPKRLFRNVDRLLFINTSSFKKACGYLYRPGSMINKPRDYPALGNHTILIQLRVTCFNWNFSCFSASYRNDKVKWRTI